MSFKIIEMNEDNVHEAQHVVFPMLKKEKMYASQEDNKNIENRGESYLYQLYCGKVNYEKLYIVLSFDENNKINGCLICQIDITKILKNKEGSQLFMPQLVSHHQNFLSQHKKLFEEKITSDIDLFYLGEINCFVKKDARGKGIATEMMKILEKHSLSQQKRENEKYFFKARDKAFDIAQKSLSQIFVAKMSPFDPGFNMMVNSLFKVAENLQEKNMDYPDFEEIEPSQLKSTNSYQKRY